MLVKIKHHSASIHGMCKPAWGTTGDCGQCQGRGDHTTCTDSIALLKKKLRQLGVENQFLQTVSVGWRANPFLSFYPN